MATDRLDTRPYRELPIPQRTVEYEGTDLPLAQLRHGRTWTIEQAWRDGEIDAYADQARGVRS